MKRVVIVIAVVVALLVAGGIYYRVGWDFMVGACAYGPQPGGSQGVGYDFTDRGFTCTYDDGTVRSSWWWMW